MIEQIKNYIKTIYFYVVLITILSIAVLAFMFYWGNGIFQPVQVSEKIYYADNISPTHKLLIDKFNQIHAGKIEVVPINLPFEKFSTNERKELLIRYLRSKSDRIDIFSVDQIWIPRFTKWTETLNRYFMQSEKELLVEQALKSCYYNGDLVAIPLYFDISLLYYNDDQLKKLPSYSSLKNELKNFITWERFFEFGKELEKYDKPIYLFPADNYEGLMCSFIELMESQNAKIFVGDTINLTTKEAEKSLQLLVDLVSSGITPRIVTEYRETECYNKFVNENGFFLRGWTGLNVWYNQNIKNEDVSTKYLVAPLPHFKYEKPASITGGWNLMLSKNSKNKSASIEFIKFMMSEQSQRILFEKGGYLPIIRKIYDDSLFVDSHPAFKEYKRIIETAAFRPFNDKYTRGSDVIAYFLKEAILKNISVKEALSNAQRVINSREIFIR